MSAFRELLLVPLLFACQATSMFDTRVPKDLEDLLLVCQRGG